MSQESPDQSHKELIIRPSTGLVTLPDGSSSPMAEIISRSIAHIQTRKALAIRYRVGEHELLWPDYHLVCAWAEQLQMTREEVLNNLLIPGFDSWMSWDTSILNGRFNALRIDETTLPIFSVPSITGLAIESLSLGLTEEFSRLELSIFPNLRKLSCRVTELRELDLSGTPLLTELLCDSNRLMELDLFCVPLLTVLWCDSNPLGRLNLSGVPLLAELRCGGNRLKELDLSAVSRLKVLSCSGSRLATLDLTPVPYLTKLSFGHVNGFFGHNVGEQLSKIDLSVVPLLEELNCTSAELTELDLSSVHLLSEIKCDNNHLTELNLSAVPCLTILNCSNNHLARLDLSRIPRLTILKCDRNQLTELDLSVVPLITHLSCRENHLMTTLDIRPLKYLSSLEYDKNQVLLIQRPDQNFK